MTIHEYIKQLRTDKSLTINRLGYLAGIDSSYLSRMERMERNPSPATLKKLAPYLNTTYEHLMQVAGFTNPDLVPLDKYNKIEGVIVTLIRDLVSKKIITDENNIPYDIMAIIISAVKLEIKIQRDNFAEE